jgi:acetyl-CoA/propionyl-CoA carboxylase, biotin carboxylase, biotin carboxyl carrier protein
MFSTVLVANRGEIALRVMYACRELGLRTVAVYSEADQDAPHVRYADDARLIGPAPATYSYLNIGAIIAAARDARAGAIHPGYGFLAENPAFARACHDAGIVFIGPSADAMERMGGKIAARREAQTVGVPVVKGTPGPVATPDDVRRFGAEHGYPVAIKASAGGGGRGLRIAASAEAVEEAFDAARREAEAYFGDGALYVEQYLARPRHIEVQILADHHGTVLHLGERDCSVQRRHQKLIEEAPSPALDAQGRAAIGAAAVRLAQHVGYHSAGTVEFLWQDEAFFFLEMNTRIQVEHPVTEALTGVDLVKWQLRIAQGERLPWTQADIVARGHAIECRINAENPADQFRPSLGTLTTYREPHGLGVRVDSGFVEGATIPPFYDSLVAKLITWGQDRDEARARMRRALDDFVVGGVHTTLPFHRWAMTQPVFAAGEATIRFVEEHFADALLPSAPPVEPPVPDPTFEGARAFEVEVNGRRFAVRVTESGKSSATRPTARRSAATKGQGQPGVDQAIRTPLGGTLRAVNVAVGDRVAAGQVVMVIEAMKMENEITAPRDGVIADVRAAPGASVQAGDTLAMFAAE